MLSLPKRILGILFFVFLITTAFLYFYVNDIKKERFSCIGNFLNNGEIVKKGTKAYIMIERFGLLQSTVSGFFNTRKMFGRVKFTDDFRFEILYAYSFTDEIILLNEIGNWSSDTDKGNWNYLSNNIFLKLNKDEIYDGHCERDVNYDG